MKHICVPLSILGCLYASSVYAQQLVAPAGRESPAASWVIGEVVGGYYQTDDGMIVQGILSYIDLSSSVGMEEDEWQEKTMIWPSPVVEYLHPSVCFHGFYQHLFAQRNIGRTVQYTEISFHIQRILFGFRHLQCAISRYQR